MPKEEFSRGIAGTQQDIQTPSSNAEEEPGHPARLLLLGVKDKQENLCKALAPNASCWRNLHAPEARNSVRELVRNLRV